MNMAAESLSNPFPPLLLCPLVFSSFNRDQTHDPRKSHGHSRLDRSPSLAFFLDQIFFVNRQTLSLAFSVVQLSKRTASTGLFSSRCHLLILWIQRSLVRIYRVVPGASRLRFEGNSICSTTNNSSAGIYCNFPIDLRCRFNRTCSTNGR